MQYRLKLKQVINTAPTIGFSMETNPTKYESLAVWDVGGQDKIRQLWKHYYQGCERLIFVVDSNDRTRFSEARDELNWILESDEMEGVPVVVLANKQDLPQAHSPSDVAAKLGLHEMKNRRWFVQGTSATSGQGVYEGMEELSSLVKNFQSGKGR